MYRRCRDLSEGPLSRSCAQRQDVASEEREGVSAESVGESVREDRSASMRLDLIARVRAEIANGTYDTPEKWEAALGRLLERMDLT